MNQARMHTWKLLQLDKRCDTDTNVKANMLEHNEHRKPT